MSNLNSIIDSSIQHLKDEMGREGLQRKKDNNALETRLEVSFKKEETERKKVQDELAFM